MPNCLTSYVQFTMITFCLLTAASMQKLPDSAFSLLEAKTKKQRSNANVEEMISKCYCWLSNRQSSDLGFQLPSRARGCIFFLFPKRKCHRQGLTPFLRTPRWRILGVVMGQKQSPSRPISSFSRTLICKVSAALVPFQICLSPQQQKSTVTAPFLGLDNLIFILA